MKNKKTSLLGIIAAVLLVIGYATGIIPGTDALPADTAAVETVQTTKTESKKADEPITAPQDIADYLFENGRLPDNFITKKEAQALGWDNSKNYVSDVAPGKSIGGDRFGNYEGLLPKATGRTYYEADCNYTTGPRNAQRIVYSSDGLVYYTSDHYATFTEMKPSK